MRNDSDMSDESLRNLLKQWQIDTPLPPAFQNEVWRRIGRTQRSSLHGPSVWSALAHWLGMRLPRPAFAASYATIFLVIGLSAGWAHAREENERVKDALGNRYVRLIDPYLAPRQ